MIPFHLDEQEVEFHAIRAQGAGGQNINKVSSAVHLRFDIRASSLPEILKQRLLALSDQRITRDGVVVLKAQEARTRERNRQLALMRLAALIESVAETRKVRRPTQPGLGARKRRLEAKSRRGAIKALRGRIAD